MDGIYDRAVGRKNQISPLTKMRFMDAALADLGHGLAYAVLTKLVQRCNGQTGECFPSYGTLAKDVGASRRGVIGAVGHLAQRGWIKRDIHGGRTYRGGTSNSFSFPWKRGQPSEQTDANLVNKTTQPSEMDFGLRQQDQEVIATNSEGNSEYKHSARSAREGELTPLARQLSNQEKEDKLESEEGERSRIGSPPSRPYSAADIEIVRGAIEDRGLTDIAAIVGYARGEKGRFITEKIIRGMHRDGLFPALKESAA